MHPAQTSVLVPLVPSRQQIVQSDPAGCLPKSGNPIERATHTITVTGRRRYKMRHGPTMAGNDDGFTLLDLIKKLRQPGFNLGGLDFAHDNLF